MTVVNPKSISGITSITTASGSDNLLTIHTSDANNTERLRIDSTGTTKIVTGIVTTLTATGSAKVGSGVTLSPDGDIFATGVTTSTTVQVGSATTIHTTGIDLGDGNLTGHNLHSTGITTSSSVIVGGGVTISESGIEASGIGITVANINGAQIGGRRNLIINGGMNVAQRGISTTTNGYGTVDRFKLNRGGTDESPTQEQATLTSAPGPYREGHRKAFKITNGNQTNGANESDFVLIDYFVEAQDIATSGWDYIKPESFITYSFWVKSSVAQNFYGSIRSMDGTSQNFPFETGSLTADTWKKVILKIPGNSNLTFNNDNGQGFRIRLSLWRGTNATGSITLNQWSAFNASVQYPNHTSTWYTTNDATFMLTGVQLEVGSQVTPFEHRSYGEEFRLCQRYYQEVLFNEQNTGGGILRASNSNNFQQPASIQQFGYMRAAASGAVIGSNSLVYCRRLNGSSSDITASVSHAGGTTHGFINIRLTGTSSGTFTNEEPYVWWCRESDGQIMFSQDAEL